MLPGVRNWEIVIVIAIAISFHSIEEALGGSVSAPTAIVRLVLAGLLSWAAVALFEGLWHSYSSAARQRQLTDFIRQRLEAAQNAETPTGPPSNNQQ